VPVICLRDEVVEDGGDRLQLAELAEPPQRLLLQRIHVVEVPCAWAIEPA
jgi:hypothetical protein